MKRIYYSDHFIHIGHCAILIHNILYSPHVVHILPHADDRWTADTRRQYFCDCLNGGIAGDLA